MTHKVILLMEFESAGHLATPLRQILESWPNSDFQLASHTSQGFDAGDNELSEIVLKEKPSLILLALSRVQLKSLDEMLQALGPAASSAPVVVVVEANEEELNELVRPGVADFIIPPLRELEVLVRLRRLLNQVGQEQRTRRALTEKLGLQQLIGQHPVFVAETRKIPVLARSDTSVLISGETGTGKEMVGRAIHYLSPRAGKPFVPVNCGAIPVELLENELFGHDKGAFTGAAGSRDGLIQEAEQGTLFLDEVNSLPLLAQVKLLRFLQSKEYRPLGSTKALTGDVRIIAASNANLEAEVAAGALRQDLYYRLNVVPIVLPPLRARANDIILLARNFLAQYAAKLDSPVTGFSPEAERKLLLYSWPGNVRELEHVIERVVVLCTERIIQEHHIVLSGENDQLARLSFHEMKAKVIAQFETDYIQNLLTAYKGNITKAAQVAQKERRTFWALVQKHKIDVRKFRAANFTEQGKVPVQVG
jgi:two-component system, NtrC family, response regulator GlrR